MNIKIVKDSNPIMRKKSLPVDLPLSKEDKRLLDDMSEYLRLSQDEEYTKKHHLKTGVGLAAIQTGSLKRMFCVYIKTDEDEIHYQIVNPKIIETSVRKCALKDGEGCLSVDNPHEGLVHRYYKIKLEAYDALTDEFVTLTLKGYLAIVFQHEYDHLDGKFFYDRINKDKPNQPLINEEII